jgi:hypothetical protein
MAVISAVSAGTLLIWSSIFVNHYWNTSVGVAMYTLEILMGLAMLVVGIATAALTCGPLCCQRPVAGTLHYTPGTAGWPAVQPTVQPTVQPIVQPIVLPAGLLRGQENPPSAILSFTMKRLGA